MQFGMAKGQSRGDVFAMSPTYRRSKSIKSLQKFMDHNPHHPPKTPVTAVPTSAPPLRTQYSEIPESETEAKQVRKNKRKLSSEPLAELRTMIEEDDEGIQYSLEDGRETKLEFQKLYIIEMGVALIAVIGGFMTVLNYDLEYDERDQELSLIMLWVITVTSVITVFLNVVRYLQKLKYMKARNVISRKATLYSTGDLWIVLLESVFIMLQPYPGLQGIKLEEFSEASNINYYYHVNDIFSLLIICRIFLVLRFVLNSLSYRTPRSHRITSMYGADSDYLYACRCIMKMMPIQGVLVILLCSIVGFGYLIRICESPLSRDIDGTGDMSFSTYWNSMWCVILTMTTVGYGDVYARTMLGRAVSFLMCIWGIFLVSLMVVTLTNILTMSAPEEKSLMILRRLELRKNLKKDAAYILTNIARIGLTRKKNISAEKKNTATKEIVKDIKHHLNSFKLVSREVKGLDDSVGPMEEVNRQVRCLREDVKTIMEAQEKLQKTVHQFVSAPKSPNKFDSRGFADSKLNLRDFEEDVVIRGTR